MAESAVAFIMYPLFALLCVQFRKMDSWRTTLLFMLFATLGFYSSAAGIMLYLLPVFYFYRRKVNWTKWAGYLVFVLVSFTIYFYDYNEPSRHPNPEDSIFLHPIETVKYFLVLTGNTFIENPYGATAFGFAITTLVGVVVYKKYYKTNETVFLQIAVMFATLGLIAIARSNLGISQSYSPRYNIYVACLLGLLAIALTEIWQPKIKLIHMVGAVALALILNYTSFGIYIPKIEQEAKEIEGGMTNWLTRYYQGEPKTMDAKGLWVYDYTYKGHVLPESIKRGYYKPDFKK